MISPASVTNCYMIMKSNNFNGGHWTDSAFHKLQYYCIIYAKIIILYQPYFLCDKGKTWSPCQSKGKAS